MEDILASIRRIISDDQGSGPEESAELPSPLSNVLDLAERHISPILQADTSAQDRDGWNDISVAHGNVYPMDNAVSALKSGYEMNQAALKAVQPGLRAHPESSEADIREALLSSQAEASVSEAFGKLGTAIPQHQPQSMEDVVKEMLRPMLKAWLDDNLPAMVERLVQDEIERVSRRRA